MDKYQALAIVKDLFFKAIQDDALSSFEINSIQEWIDEYAVLFYGEDYKKIIIPLQKFVDDGDFTFKEIESTYNILRSFGKK